MEKRGRRWGGLIGARKKTTKGKREIWVSERRPPIRGRNQRINHKKIEEKGEFRSSGTEKEKGKKCLGVYD